MRCAEMESLVSSVLAMRIRREVCWRWSMVFWLAIGIADQPSLVFARESSGMHRVLIVYENESTQVAAVEIARGLHKDLDDRDPTQFEIYSEYLDNARFPDPGNLPRIAAQLSAKYRDMKPDVAIAAGPTALRFMLDHRREIAPGAPLLFGAVAADAVTQLALPPDVKGIVTRFDLKQTMTLARRLQPNARHAVVISGSSAFDKRWEATARADLGDRYDGFDIRYLSGLRLDGFADAVARLSPDTAVLILTIFQDPDGRNFVPRNATAEIARVSAAPVYAVYDTYLDHGVLGGYMSTFQEQGEQLAALVTHQIAGEANLPQITPLVIRPIVDWREIRRFLIDPGLLPPDAEIRFRAPSLWDEHRTAILVSIAMLLLQSGTIVALGIQAHLRKKAEAEVNAGHTKLVHLSRTSLLGELSGAFAHELNQPLTSILANAEVGKQLLESSDPSLTEVSDILSDIIADDERAAEISRQLRRLLTTHEVALEPVDLNHITVATLALVKSELLIKQTAVAFKRANSSVRILGNAAQLQQVVLNIIINAVDATSHLPPSARMIEVAVRTDGRTGEVTVTDNGCGLTPEFMEGAFQPFVSTKSNGLGLGLAICRSIAQAHGGALEFDPEYLAGARIILSLPLRRRSS
ncbi:GHKL domain-containing protein [Mesorhizobium sp. M8A.F.Ca.ET.021.01.1.1]|nr:GHKL domain-containing protein [Mesorhizobium sp. M8A.F.Ca.ET.021.01.1.1]